MTFYTDIEQVEGPPNWDELWPDWQSIGTDHTRKTSPLNISDNRRIMTFLRESKEEYKDILFVKRMGEGLFGEVWAVSIGGQNGTKRRMACKLVRLEQSGDTTLKEAVDAMMADMLVLRYLQHKNIIKFIDFVGIPDSQTGFLFSNVLMFMELMDGDLANIMKKMGADSKMPVDCCLHWFKQIGSALRYMHDKNVVHFDLKPNNILYAYRRRAKASKQMQWKDIKEMIFKLGDFGLSICYDSEDKNCWVDDQRGNYMFQSPEMIFKKSGTSIRGKPCDIYSLGMCLANVYVGEQLFDSHVFEISDHMEEACSNNGPFAQDLPIDPQTIPFCQLVYWMTIHDPNKRPDIESIMK